MKNLVFCMTFLMTIYFSYSYGQAPDAFKYQAVARSSTGNILFNQQVNFRIGIIQGIISNTPIFEETHLALTNAFGLVNLEIGNGTPVSGAFNTINWANSPYFIKVEIDATGGNIFTMMGTSQLLSVPFAMYAVKAGNLITSNDHDTSATNELQQLSISDNELTISNGNTVMLPIGSSIGTSNFIPKYVSPTSLANSVMYQSGNKIGVGTQSPTGRVQIQADSTALSTEPLFEIKDKFCKTVMVVDQDSIHFYVKDPGSSKSQAKGSFAVSGKNDTKGFTNNFLLINSDSTRIYTGDTTKGFGVQSIGASGNKSYMQLTPLNYFIGHEAGSVNGGGIYNSFIGYQSGKYTSSGHRNTFMGYQSGFNNLTGYNNVFLGLNAGYNNLGGFNNVFIGVNSGFNNTEGGSNTFLGLESGLSNTTGGENTFIGGRSGLSSVTGNANTFLGFASGFANTSGDQNTFLGSYAGSFNTIGNHNLFIGNYSGYSNISGDDNIFMGYYAGHDNISGLYNIFVGRAAGYSNKTGSNNIFIGRESGFFCDSAVNNIGLGISTGYSLSNGWRNIFIGNYSGNATTIGSDNTFCGSESGLLNKTGNGNAFFGTESGRNGITGNNNTFIGSSSGRENQAGNNNCFIGNASGQNNKGSSNVFLGNYSGYNNHGSDNIFIGFTSGMNDTTSGKLYIANSARTLMYGDFNQGYLGIGTTTPTRTLEVNGNAKIGIKGTTITNIIKVTVNSNLPNIASGISSIQTFTVPDAMVGSSVYISPQYPLSDGLDISYARVSANGTVEVKFRNNSVSAIAISAMDWYITIIE